MEKTLKEIMKAYMDSQKFNSTTEIMEAMKEMFRDVLQQVMESELDAELGYEKSQRMSDCAVENKPRNYRSGHSNKTVKKQLGAVEVKVPPRSERSICTTDYRQVQPERGRNGREDSRAVRLWNEPAGHLGTNQESVRCGHLTGVGK